MQQKDSMNVLGQLRFQVSLVFQHNMLVERGSR